jgi:quercetin dioxygenase-like cupin family protein
MIKFFRKIRYNHMNQNITGKPTVAKAKEDRCIKYVIAKIMFITIAIFSASCESKPSLPDPLEAGWQGVKVCEVLVDNEKFRTLKCTFPPGVGHERHYHAAHFGYTLKGGRFRIKDTTGIREVDVPTGYNFYNEKIEWHEVQNIGDSTAIFLIIEPK